MGAAYTLHTWRAYRQSADYCLSVINALCRLEPTVPAPVQRHSTLDVTYGVRLAEFGVDHGRRLTVDAHVFHMDNTA